MLSQMGDPPINPLKLGYMYVADLGGRVKIGWAKNPKKRMGTLGEPSRAVAFRAPIPVWVEMRFHCSHRDGRFEKYPIPFEEAVERVVRWHRRYKIRWGHDKIEL